jgi:hypothetical protein
MSLEFNVENRHANTVLKLFILGVNTFVICTKKYFNFFKFKL